MVQGFANWGSDFRFVNETNSEALCSISNTKRIVNIRQEYFTSYDTVMNWYNNISLVGLNKFSGTK